MTRKGAWSAALAVAVLSLFLIRLLLGGGPPTAPTAAPGIPPDPPPRPAGPVPLEKAAAPPAPSAPESRGPDEAPAPPPEPLVAIEGRVLDLRDDGIEGAEVALFQGRDLPAVTTGTLEEVASGCVYVPVGRGAVRTGADGAFRIAAPAGTVATIRASAPDHVPARLEGILFAEDRAGVVLRLDPAEPFEGVVRSAAGSRLPIEGADVRLLSGEGWRETTVLASARTDAEGRFRFTDAPRGLHSLLATAPGYLPLGPHRFTVPPEADRTHEIALTPAGRSTLKGVVLLPGIGGLAAGATVRVETRPGILPSVVEAVADAKGEFSLEIEVNPTRNAHHLKVLIRTEKRGAVALERKDWPGNTDERFVLEAPPSGVLRGRVVDVSPEATRAGVPGVVVEGGGLWILPVKETAVTDVDGVFVLEGIPHVKPRFGLAPDERSVAYAPGFRVPEFPTLPSEEVELEVVPLRPRRRGGSSGGVADAAPEVVPASVSGAVLGPDGQAVPGARVRGFGRGTVIADARGAFVLRAVVAAETNVTLRAEAPGFQPGVAGPMGVFPGLELRNVAIFLPVQVHGVVGRVVDLDGRPVPGARVKATRQSMDANAPRSATWWPVDPTATRADGTYRFEAPAGSTWRIEAYATRFRPGAIESVPAAGPVPDLVLVPVSAPTPR